MATTPPRPASPAPPRSIVVPKSSHNLQISPNLEALLQHDELTRRNSNSPTNAYHTSSSSLGFPISLPPPPPRVANGGRKAGQREQEPFPTARGRDGQRSKNAVVVSDFWPATDGSAAGQLASGPSSRPVSPNPYLNPTPVLRPINTPDLDEAPTPKQAEQSLANEPKSDSSRVAPETRGRAGAPDSSCRPSTALHKVEKILWLGRDSLSLFSGSANGMKRDSDRRNDRTESGDLDAVQDRRMRQVLAAPTPTASRPSTFGDSDTATVTFSSKSATSYLRSQQRGQPIGPSETPLHLTRSESGPASDPPFPPLPPAVLLPRLSLPSIFMSHNSPQRHKSADSATSNDYLSFIDFFSPSTVDELDLCNIQDKTQETRSSRQRLQSISIPPPSLYSIPRHSLSSTSLASMKFAPPSPTSTVHQLSPTYPASASSSSSVRLPSMIFAPPSPSAERVPTRLQPLSDPPSPYSPLELAPPPSPQRKIINEPCLSVAPELIAERGRKLKSKKRSKSSSPYHVHNSASPLPPTTNELHANERADRIRRNRKLARVFGRALGAEDPIAEADDLRVSKKLHSPSFAALLTKQKNHRHAASASVSLKAPGVTTEPSTPWTDNLWSPDGRRHSTPLASDFTLYVDGHQDAATTKDPFRSCRFMDSPEAASTRSFIDLSDEDPRDDDVSELSCFAVHQNRHRRIHQSNSTPSLVESLDSLALAEVERRRKREKLARLHRFLGSRVPLEAVSGGVFGPPLPPPATVEEHDREHKLRENMNAPLDDFDRSKEELDEREKALKVRRAQKMEKVFGTPPPPQALYHTRPSRPAAPLSQPASPTDVNPYVLHLDFASSSRNQNQSAYVGKTLHRRGPSDSSRCLLEEDTPQSSPSSIAQSFADSFAGSLSGYQQALAQSSVYLNYQHSLNSLIDIIDRDDRQSLIELHRFLRGCEANGCEANGSSSEEEVAVNPRRVSNATSLRSERRHSLPSNASMTSLSSEFYTSPQTSRFQIRRRKAAKLTNFFGVDYRELIHDILESIEKGVEEERKQGTLQPQEVEVLIHRVRSLRKMKDPFPS